MAAYTTIDDPELHFQIKLYTGNSTDDTSITLDGEEDMAPDLIWFNCRSHAEARVNHDSPRGVLKRLFYGTGDTEASSADALQSFDANGWTMGVNDQLNSNTETYVSWCWKGGTTAVPSGGSITPSAVSFSATSGFGVYKWTGTGANGNIAHGLGVAPKLLLIKNTEITSGWQVGSTTIGFTKVIYINSTAIPDTSATVWNDTAPSATLFTVGSNNGSNKGSDVMMCYAFADVQGFSKLGSYEGNGKVDGTFVYTGFRPAWVMTKSFDSTSDWFIFDNKRAGYNPDNNQLWANRDAVESTQDMIDILSNGFKFRIATDPNVAETYIYMAFAEAPFVNSNGVPCNAR